MTQFSYLVHRLAKRVPPSLIELALLDRDLANVGVRIPSSTTVTADQAVRTLVYRAMRDAMQAA